MIPNCHPYNDQDSDDDDDEDIPFFFVLHAFKKEFGFTELIHQITVLSEPTYSQKGV